MTIIIHNIIIMKKVKTITLNRIVKIIPVLALVLFVSCLKENVIDGKNEQDELLIKLNSVIASTKFDQLKSGNVEYFSIVNKYSVYAKELSVSVGEEIRVIKKKRGGGKLGNADLKDFLNTYPKPVCFEDSTTDFEKSVMKITIQSLKSKNSSESIQILNVIEGFISDNICDNNQQERFFYFIAALRQSYLSKLGHSSLIDPNAKLKSAKIIALSGASWDYCWDNCMSVTYDNYNLIDWIQFGLNPPADVAWNTASCAWDCSWE